MHKHSRKSLRLSRNMLSIIGALIAITLLCGASAAASQSGFLHPYGVFLSLDASQSSRFTDYQTVVIDAAYFEKADINELKNAGHTVYSYLNIGSLEDFRPYYKRFEADTLAPYEHWAGERWMDVSDSKWQDYLCDVLAAAYLSKGVDGFFIDNCDVYYLYPTQEIFDGLSGILRNLRATGADVIINGGDVFITEYESRFANLSDILTGVNQECVLTAIDFDRGTFSRASAEDRQYFSDYIEHVAKAGARVFLLEYNRDPALMAEIADYCADRGYTCYIAGSIELD